MSCFVISNPMLQVHVHPSLYHSFQIHTPVDLLLPPYVPVPMTYNILCVVSWCEGLNVGNKDRFP